LERVVAFFTIQALATVYALVRGGAPERMVGASLLAASGIGWTLQTPFGQRFYGVEYGVLAVDLVLAIVLVAIALAADRFWTLWLAAMQLLGLGSHLVRVVEPGFARTAYAVLLAGWSYPMLLILVLGTARHVRRVSRMGFDVAWTPRN